ncbi:MAG: DUF2007 domain-containing protein [Clostridia bacterium]|nr:DUF2007 domain-containing protein [Clostridia bacterium]
MDHLRSWKKLSISKNQIEADILKGYLESFGIKVMLKNEAVGRIYGLVDGPLAEVEFWVPESQYDHAVGLLEAFNGNQDSNSKI